MIFVYYCKEVCYLLLICLSVTPEHYGICFYSKGQMSFEHLKTDLSKMDVLVVDAQAVMSVKMTRSVVCL
jgi:hypothetical protein